MSIKQGGNTIAGSVGEYPLNERNISNCITYIPQDIKLELNNGTLTLKAGSKVYVPNGSGVFDEVVIENDLTKTITYLNNVQGVVYITNDNTIDILWIGYTFSGNTIPTSQLYELWYDTVGNLVQYSSDQGSTWTSGHSLPIAVVKGNSSGITSIDQVFNGFGYIGSTVFALPGVKGLIPDGRNADGTLKNIAFTVSSVLTHTGGYNDKLQWIVLSSNSIAPFDIVDWIGYNIQENILFNKEGSSSATGGSKISGCVCAFLSANENQKITAFTPKTAFHALDYNDTEFIAHQAMPGGMYIDLTLGSSGSTYTAPADGYFYLRKISNASGQVVILGNASSGYMISTTFSSGTNQYLTAYVPAKKGDTILCEYSAGGSTQWFRFIYANGAQ